MKIVGISPENDGEFPENPRTTLGISPTNDGAKRFNVQQGYSLWLVLYVVTQLSCHAVIRGFLPRRTQERQRKKPPMPPKPIKWLQRFSDPKTGEYNPHYRKLGLVHSHKRRALTSSLFFFEYCLRTRMSFCLSTTLTDPLLDLSCECAACMHMHVIHAV